MNSRDPRLHDELKRFIVRRLRLEQIDPAGLADDAPLLEGGLDLDSIDLLELVVALENEYGVKFEDVDESRRVLTTVATLAEYVASRRRPA